MRHFKEALNGITGSLIVVEAKMNYSGTELFIANCFKSSESQKDIWVRIRWPPGRSGKVRLGKV